MSDGHKKCVFERLPEITVEISKQRKNVRCSHAPEEQQSTEKYLKVLKGMIHICDQKTIQYNKSTEKKKRHPQ